MLFHDKYTFTIGRIAKMFDTGDINLVKSVRFWLPKRLIARAYYKFYEEFNILFNEKSVKTLQKDRFLILKSYNRTELFLTAMYKGLTLPHSNKNDKKLKQMYLEEFGRECKTQADIDFILNRIDFYREKRNDKVKEIEEKNKTENKQSFYEVIANVENVLGLTINESMNLNAFVIRYKLALTKIKQLETNNVG